MHGAHVTQISSPWRHDTGGVRAHDRTSATHRQGAEPQRVVDRDAFGVDHDEPHARVDGFLGRGEGHRRGHGDHRGRCPGGRDGLVDGVEYWHPAGFGAATTRPNAGNQVRAGAAHVFGEVLAGTSGEALHQNPAHLGNKDRHRARPRSAGRSSDRPRCGMPRRFQMRRARLRRPRSPEHRQRCCRQNARPPRVGWRGRSRQR